MLPRVAVDTKNAVLFQEGTLTAKHGIEDFPQLYVNPTHVFFQLCVAKFKMNILQQVKLVVISANQQ